MSYPVFEVPAGDVLPILFSTYAGATGASITLTGLAVTDIEIYKDGSVTQRASDAGYTLLDTDGIDFDGITGIHGFSIDTGDNTDAGFYTVGAWFTVVVSAVTVDSATVTFIAAQFRLMPAEGVAAHPKVDVGAWLGTAAATPTTAGVPEVDITFVGGSAVSASSGLMNANVTQISGDSTAADNLEAYTDGTTPIPANATQFAGTAYATALAAEVDAVWDEAVDGSYTARQSLRIANSANAGEVSGAATTTVVVRDISDSKDRITATVDSSGNRTAVTVDAT
jgi:hypothetical protein